MERRVIFFLYRLLAALAFPFLLIYLLVRIVRDPRYRDKAGERFGFLPFLATQRGGVWLHAVSVGEVLAAAELVKEYAARFPASAIYVSVTTLAGRELAEKRLGGRVDGIFYAPFDYCFAVRRVLRALDPALVVILETEIWPNLWNETKRRGAGLVVLNARISDRAWPRYRRLRAFFAPVLALPDRILAQSATDAERWRGAGGQAEVAGNLKYDITVLEPVAEVREWIRAHAPSRIWVAASTMGAVIDADRDEEVLVAEAFESLLQKWPKLLLVLAPRKPERFDAVAAMLAARGIRCVRRSALGPMQLPGVLLVDTIGELAGLFALADVVFVGGSLVHWGGHNVLEPAASGRPILVGPHMQNFAAIAGEFHAAGAMRETTGLAADVDELLRDAGGMGERARRCAERHRGAVKHAVNAMVGTLEQTVTHEPGRRWLEPLCWLWRAGVAFDRWRRTGREPLPAPVISVGNLTVGGVGKTPLVAWLAERLDDPGILTRGYGRQSQADVVLAPGEAASVESTGDEAQEHLRDGFAALGIGADRRRVARSLFARLRPKCFILDDGYQHWPVPRQMNICVIDTQDPFGGGHVLPRGRLRETPAALRRADVIVLSRTEIGREYPKLKALIRRYNDRAPVVHMRTKPLGMEPPLPVGPFDALCAIGNPGAFRATLREMGLTPEVFRVFPDHHVYTISDLDGFSRPLVTTGKDQAKLVALGLAVPVYRLRTGVEIQPAEEFVDLVRAVII